MSMNDVLIICRLCLNMKMDLENLFHFEKISDTILILVMECTTVKIDLTDGYSNVICTNCLDLLKKFHDFRTMCHKSDLILKNYRGIINKVELANYLEKYRNNELQLNDEGIFKKEESNNVDLSSLSNGIEFDFSDNSEKISIRDECNVIESLPENKLDNPLIEKKCMKNSLTKTKLSTRLKPQRKERRNSKRQIRRKQNKLTESKTKSKKELRVCYICGKLTLTITEHLITHKSVRDWKCEKCGKMFSNRAAVRKHQRVHTPNKGHVCEKCGTSFVTKHTLARHIRTVHFPTKAYECSICSRRFEHAYNLKVHKMKHSGEKPYKCKYCPENFTCKIKFREHNMNQHNVTPPALFKCEKCNLTFVYNFQLQAHKKRPEHETGGIFECTMCDEKFVKQRLYQKHMKLKHELKNETKAIDAKCNVCNKTFKQLRYLKQHEKLHSENGKKFKCEICGKAFLCNAFLKEHTRIHTGERPAKCDFCNNAYISFRQLKKHIKSHKTISS